LWHCFNGQKRKPASRFYKIVNKLKELDYSALITLSFSNVYLQGNVLCMFLSCEPNSSIVFKRVVSLLIMAIGMEKPNIHVSGFGYIEITVSKVMSEAAV
jgi:hypothetical protein